MDDEQIKSGIYKSIINKLFKMLCWRDEKKRWLTLYEELLADISMGEFDEEIKGQLLLRIVPLRYYDFSNFRQTIFEVINYVDSLRGVYR